MSRRRTLVIFGPAKLSRQGERVSIIGKPESAGIPARYIDIIVLLGKVSISGPALSLTLEKRIPVFFMTKFGNVKGVLFAVPYSSAYSNRLKQYKRYTNGGLEVAKRIVHLKINKIQHLFGIDLSELRAGVKEAVSVDSLLGTEGTASRLMFQRFKGLIRGAMGFEIRNYRPPTDPVNALLSLSYTFAYYLALPLVVVAGYDPYISFLHSKRGTHCAFCSDVIEPVRPLITSLLVDPIKRKVFTEKDFVKDRNGYFLKKESYSKFVNWFESSKDAILVEIKKSIESLSEVI